MTEKTNRNIFSHLTYWQVFASILGGFQTTFKEVEHGRALGGGDGQAGQLAQTHHPSLPKVQKEDTMFGI